MSLMVVRLLKLWSGLYITYLANNNTIKMKPDILYTFACYHYNDVYKTRTEAAATAAAASLRMAQG